MNHQNSIDFSFIISFWSVGFGVGFAYCGQSRNAVVNILNISYNIS